MCDRCRPTRRFCAFSDHATSEAMQLRSCFSIVVLAVSLTRCSCGDEPTEAPRCERDPALIAEQRACVGDEHCPCGTSCLLGRCAAECATNEDCGGGRCDEFGRCRDARDTELAPPAPRTVPPRITISEVSLDFQDPTVTRII